MAEERKPLTAREMKDRISLRQADDIVVIRRETLHPGIGGQSCIPIVGVHTGFDWDQGKLFLEPEVPMAVAGAEFELEQRAAALGQELIGWLYVILNDAKIDDAGKVAALRWRLEKSTNKRRKPKSIA
jgi:hypothetical protein